MTREEAIVYFKNMNECTYGDVEPIQMAIKALEQGPVLDKIRAEIEQTAFMDVNDSKYIFVNRVNQIIDKYKAESEG